MNNGIAVGHGSAPLALGRRKLRADLGDWFWHHARSMQPARNLKLDLVALGLLALVVFLTLALFTYNPADPPSTLVYPASDKVHNACGRFGAIVAEGLFRLVGLAAYGVVLSLAVVDGMLLMRRSISEPVLRTIGWVMTLVGVATLAALAMPHRSPGPVIGAGGYLGATGRGLLETNFAMAGSYILTLSVILSGLLLCTDYLVVRLGMLMFHAPAAGALARVQNLKLRRAKLAADDLANLPQVDGEVAAAGKTAEKNDKKGDGLSVRIGGKRLDNAAEATEEADAETESAEIEEAAPVIKASKAGKGAKAAAEEPEEAEEEDEDDSEAEEEEAAEETPAKKGAPKKSLLSSLRIKNATTKKNERDELIQEIEAASREDEMQDYELPPIDLLLASEFVHQEGHEKEVRQKAKTLEKTFADFGFKVKVVEIETGPVIAQYEIELEAGLRLSKITSLSDDLAIALRVPSVRIVAPIPGKNTVGIEVPNSERQLVRLREVIEECNGKAKKMKIPIFLGKDVSGNPMIVDLATLPHLLIAGRTGTGKSVCLNSIIVSMLMTRRPDEVRMLMIDPKMVELSPYKKLPHLMHPVVTDMRKAEAILAWAVEKMEERYALLAQAGVRHIAVYNQLGEEELMDRLQPEDDEQRAQIPRNLPYIVIVADEIADLMMTAGKEVEQHIIRLAQKSRAVGIHLILATQKPTVDVITGLIKSNLPARIAFQVASRTDSRVVLDEMGADKLLGNGDMLFLWPGTSTLLRGQGTYLSDDEINRVVDFVGTTEPQFVKELVQLKTPSAGENNAEKIKSRDELYEAALDVVVREGRGSVSLLQRALGIGYGRAARLVDYMAEDGIVGDYNGSQAREVLITVEQLAEMLGGEAAPSPPPVPPKAKRNKIRPEPEPVEEEAEEEAEIEDEVEEEVDESQEENDEDSEEEYEEDEEDEEEDGEDEAEEEEVEEEEDAELERA